jgi:hypothetical protein
MITRTKEKKKKNPLPSDVREQCSQKRRIKNVYDTKKKEILDRITTILFENIDNMMSK